MSAARKAGRHWGALARSAINKDVGKGPTPCRFIRAQIAHAKSNDNARIANPLRLDLDFQRVTGEALAQESPCWR